MQRRLLNHRRWKAPRSTETNTTALGPRVEPSKTPSLELQNIGQYWVKCDFFMLQLVVYLVKSNPCRPDKLRGFQKVEAPRFLNNRHMKVVNFSALRTGRLYHRANIPGTQFILEAESTSKYIHELHQRLSKVCTVTTGF